MAIIVVTAAVVIVVFENHLASHGAFLQYLVMIRSSRVYTALFSLFAPAQIRQKQSTLSPHDADTAIGTTGTAAISSSRLIQRHYEQGVSPRTPFVHGGGRASFLPLPDPQKALNLPDARHGDFGSTFQDETLRGDFTMSAGPVVLEEIGYFVAVDFDVAYEERGRYGDVQFGAAVGYRGEYFVTGARYDSFLSLSVEERMVGGVDFVIDVGGWSEHGISLPTARLTINKTRCVKPIDKITNQPSRRTLVHTILFGSSFKHVIKFELPQTFRRIDHNDTRRTSRYFVNAARELGRDVDIVLAPLFRLFLSALRSLFDVGPFILKPLPPLFQHRQCLAIRIEPVRQFY
mmetsp:Transcript_9591/g.11873  ORF Transcript_9591/g.11873 Transcript_9591/m.11873 type:complete len:347 (-) Transcript_9591:526-1566(-)